MEAPKDPLPASNTSDGDQGDDLGLLRGERYKRLKFLLMILGGFLVFLLGMGAMYAWQNYRLFLPREKFCTEEAKICPDGTSVGRTAPNCEFAPCPTIQPSPGPEIPAGWKTFINRESGYSLRIPSDMSETVALTQGGATIETVIQSVDYQEDKSLCRGGCSYPVVKGWSLKMRTQRNWQLGYDKEFFKKSPPLKLPGILSEEEKVVNGIRMLVTERTRADLPDLGNTDYYADLVDDKNNWYRIIFTTDKSKQSVQKDIFNQMLSTFRFISSDVGDASMWLTYTHEKMPEYELWKGFKIFYPRTWRLETSRRETPPATFYLSLEKDGFIISIGQAPGGGGSCLYPGDPDLEGMYGRYGSYKEILKGDTAWRIAPPEEPEPGNLYYIVCQKEPNAGNFVSTTAAGSISIKVPDQNSPTLSEVYEILERIKIID